MRVLVVHNRYRSENPSGENAVVDLEVELLRGVGVDVAMFERSSDEIDGFSRRERAGLALQPIYSASSVRRVRELAREFKPDVLHLHNPYPLISPSVLRAAHAMGVATVVTVHNYRLACANGLFFRDGHDCHDCLRRPIPYPAVVHACYRESRPQSMVLASSLVAHRSTWKSVDRFIALSPPVRDFLLAYGVPGERIEVKANTVRDPGPATALGEGFLFAGRLTAEKGVHLLIEAWNRTPEGSLGTLRIVGDGPLREHVQDWAERRSDVTYLGHRPASEMPDLIRDAAVVLAVPIWEDVCPIVAIESMALGRPVLATARGGLPFLLGDDGGWLVEGHAAALAAGLVSASAVTAENAASARRRYAREFAPPANVAALLSAYRTAQER